jgi:hypothetical protein
MGINKQAILVVITGATVVNSTASHGPPPTAIRLDGRVGKLKS